MINWSRIDLLVFGVEVIAALAFIIAITTFLNYLLRQTQRRRR